MWYCTVIIPIANALEPGVKGGSTFRGLQELLYNFLEKPLNNHTEIYKSMKQRIILFLQAHMQKKL